MEWITYTKAYTDFSGLGGTSGSVVLLAQTRLHIVDVVIENVTAFAGTTVCQGSVAAGATSYVSGQNLKTAPGNTVYTEAAYPPNGKICNNTLASTNLSLTVNCGAQNLSLLSAGSVRVNVLCSTLPT